MELSIIIVNYNVKHFLDQCLFSVQKAIKNISCEVFVVDNNSVDGSCAMVRSKYPEVSIIENKDNVGFSKANNQAIRQSSGKYVLLLNPDTVVEEDTFEKIVDFMDAHPDAGGLGVKMIDGKGRFLPESKRGLPTPSVAFYKISGLSTIFPKSKTFGKYHLGFLSNDKTHEVEILAGAFMLLRKETLDKIGLLDETFFMYGEDIDLSYRITQAGYKNYYLPDTTIIHYKGESTKKGSINYVLVFYNAMIIFAKKHFSKKNAKTFSILIHSAIYLRAFLAIINQFIKNSFLPLVDGAMLFFGYLFIKPYWEHYKFPEGGEYPKEFLHYVVPAYILIWLISIFFTGGYQRPIKLGRHIRGIALGTIIILLIYSLLSEDLRFSRALILIGAVWAIISSIIFRFLLHFMNIKPFKLNLGNRKKIAIVGLPEEAQRIASLLKTNKIKLDLAGFVSPVENGKTKNYIGHVDQLMSIVKINKIDEIIFCAKDIPSQLIIRNMLLLSIVKVDYKIAAPDSLSIVGSNSMDTAGDLYVISINSVAKDSNRRNKRVLDFSLSLLLFVCFPVLVFFVKKPFSFSVNILRVLFGFNTWVGYKKAEGINTMDLPRLKNGVLNPLDISTKKFEKFDLIERVNMQYAKDYKLLNDLFIIRKGIKDLGRLPQA